MINTSKLSDSIANSFNLAQEFSKKYPSRELSLVVTKLEEAMMWLDRYNTIKNFEEIISKNP